MSSLRQDFHESVHKNLYFFVEMIKNLSEKKELKAAYKAAPRSLKKGRTLNQIILDDLMDSYATIMATIPDDDVAPVSFYRQMLTLRNERDTTEDEATEHLSSAVALKRRQAKGKDIKLPEFSKFFTEKVSDQTIENIEQSWLSLSNLFGSLLISDAALQASYKANEITEKVALDFIARRNTVKEPVVSNDDTTMETKSPPLSKSRELKVQTNDNNGIDPALQKMLNQFAKEVVADDLPKLHGRNDDSNNLAGVLLRKDSPYILLHGEEGVGKSTVVQALTKDLNNGNGLGRLKNGRVFRVSMEKIIVVDNRPAESFLKLVKAAAEHNVLNPKDPIILYIDDYGLSSGSLAQPMATLRAYGNFAMKDNPGALIIAEVNNQQMFVIEKTDAESLKKFHKVAIDELSIEASREQLRTEANTLEKYHRIKITDEAIDHILAKTSRYIPAQFHPSKDIEVLQAAAAETQLRKEKILSLASVDLSVSKLSKLPLSLVGGEASDRIDMLEENLNKQIFGQEHAVKEIADTIGLVNQGLQDPKKPLGVFYLTGPTGVGKTALVKALAECLFANEDALIRINLGDFQEKHTVSRITGSPPGYVGYGEKTALEDVTEKPFSVILVDEAEKGHPDVDNVLMNIMDEGELTLLNGKKLNFRNSVIVFTSNLGASAAEEARDKPGIGFTLSSNASDVKKASEDVAKTRLKPEFRNRATFLALESLTPKIVEKITLKEIEKVSKRLRDTKQYAGIKIELTPEALKELMDVGFDAKLGARPMQRAMQTYLQVPLGKWLKTNKDGLLSNQFTLVVNSLKDGLKIDAKFPQKQTLLLPAPKVA